jgi:hypothetical protein
MYTFRLLRTLKVSWKWLSFSRRPILAISTVGWFLVVISASLVLEVVDRRIQTVDSSSEDGTMSICWAIVDGGSSHVAIASYCRSSKPQNGSIVKH